jgi:hypothetical protein
MVGNTGTAFAKASRVRSSSRSPTTAYDFTFHRGAK